MFCHVSVKKKITINLHKTWICWLKKKTITWIYCILWHLFGFREFPFVIQSWIVLVRRFGLFYYLRDGERMRGMWLRFWENSQKLLSDQNFLDAFLIRRNCSSSLEFLSFNFFKTSLKFLEYQWPALILLYQETP